MQLTLQVHDHLVHFYHLHALDWVDVVSALKADPEGDLGAGAVDLELAAVLARLFQGPADPAEEVRRERPARPVQERLLGQPGLQAAAGSQSDGGGALSRGARLPEGDRQDPHHLRRQEPASELAGRRRALRDQRRRHRRGRRDQHGAAEPGLLDHRPADRLHRAGLSAGPQGHRLLLQGLALRRRAVAQIGDVLRRHPGARQRLFGGQPEAAARRHHQRQSQRGAAGRSRAIPTQIQEFVTHSWYKYPDETKGLHPWDGVTEPNYELGPNSKGTQDQHRGDRRGGQVLLDQVAALEGPCHGGRAAGPLHHRLCPEQAGVQGADREAAEGSRPAGDGAVLHARPHRGARAGMRNGRRISCATSRTS